MSPSFSHSFRPFGNTFALLTLLCGCAAAQPGAARDVHPVSGRKYAMVMGYGGADWLERTAPPEEQPAGGGDDEDLTSFFNNLK